MKLKQYAKFYNAKAVDKSFQVGEQVIVLERNSNSKTFARWQTGEFVENYHHILISCLCKQTEKTDCTDFACWCYIRE